MRAKIFTAIVTGSVLALTACGGDEPSSDTTVTETVSSSTYEPDSEPISEETSLGDMALQITWDDMTATEQADLCDGWNAYPDLGLDTFMESGGDGFTREQVKAFFNEKCNY